jgi:integrase
MSSRRSNGEGSLYQRKTSGLWEGSVIFGADEQGRPIRRTVAAKSRVEARRRLNELLRLRDQGLPPPDARLTVEGLLGAWHDEELRHRVVRSTSDNYRSVYVNHITPILGRKVVAKLSLVDVNRLLAQKMDAGLSPSSVNRIRNVLSQALDYAMRQGRVSRNVAALSRGPRQPRREGRTLTPEQARQLLGALHGHRHEALFVLMLMTGVRRGEALGLMWTDVDLKRASVKIRRALRREGGAIVTGEPKTSRSRRAVNLPDQVVELLYRHERSQAELREHLGDEWCESGFVFTTGHGTPVDPRNLYREFRLVCEAAGIGRWHPHELRHSAASLMLAEGVPLQVVADVLGHASIRMTADVYGHVLPPARRAAADAMTRALFDGSHPVVDGQGATSSDAT